MTAAKILLASLALATTRQSGQLTWTEATMPKGLLGPQVTWRGNLWGTHWEQPTVMFYDGAKVNKGGKTVVPRKKFAPSMYATGSGLFLASRGDQYLFTYIKGRKPFKPGEKIRQAFTSAIGNVVSDDGKILNVELSTGAFDNYHQVKGLTSEVEVNITGMTLNQAVNFIEYSPDGLQDFVPTLSGIGIGVPLLPHLICDCGIIKGPIRGYKNTRVVLYGEYVEGNPTLWYNLPDINPMYWAPIMTGTGSNPNGSQDSTEAVRHFHGEVFVPGIGPNEGRLFAFTGDNDSQSSILICDDIADLCNNGTKWANNWAFNRYGSDRVKFLTKGAGAPYCLGAGRQEYRTVELMIDSAKRYGYYIPDQSDATDGDLPGTNTLHIVDLAAKSIRRTTNRVTGTGWVGTYAPDGTILISTDSEFGFFPKPNQYNGNCDEFCHLYALGSDKASLYEVTKFRRSDWNNPAGSVQIDRWPLAFGNLFGWDTTYRVEGGDHAGSLVKSPSLPLSR